MRPMHLRHRSLDREYDVLGPEGLLVPQAIGGARPICNIGPPKLGGGELTLGLCAWRENMDCTKHDWSAA
jgi:hypothetical protein